MKYVTALVFILMIAFAQAQVGIGTTSPSNASMMEISSTSDGINYKGFLPPRVPSQVERDDIPASSSDIGMLVFVEGTGTLEIWNGVSWETIYTLSTTTSTLAVQDFDANLSWNYTLTPTPYNVSGDIWDVVSNIGAGSTNIDLVNLNYLGCRDLDNPNGGGSFAHQIDFVNVNVSSLTNPRISFDYDVFEFDNGDDVTYEVFHDDVSQGVVTLINGAGNLTVEGTETIVIPPSVTNVRLSLMIAQNGADDYAGFDNFRVFGN